jgi:hypothetical protein
MNSALSFLGIAVGIAIVGGLIVMLFHRRHAPPASDGVDQFRQFMGALAPDERGEDG